MKSPSDPGPGLVPYVTWDEWSPHVCDYPRRPVSGIDTVVIHHQGGTCSTDEASTVRAIESWGWNRDGARVEYNLLVGCHTGTVFQGYGIDYGAHASGHNSTTFGICALGDWSTLDPPAVLVDGLVQAVRWFIERGRVVEDFDLIGHRDLADTSCPGILYGYLDEIHERAVNPDQPPPTPPGDDMTQPDLVQLEYATADGVFPTGAVLICDPYHQTHRWVTSPDELAAIRARFTERGWSGQLRLIAPEDLAMYGQRIGATPPKK
jgi:N-acetylmuramoyl-L-alanine amidase